MQQFLENNNTRTYSHLIVILYSERSAPLQPSSSSLSCTHAEREAESNSNDLYAHKVLGTFSNVKSFVQPKKANSQIEETRQAELMAYLPKTLLSTESRMSSYIIVDE